MTLGRDPRLPSVHVLSSHDPSIIHVAIDRHKTLRELTRDFRRVLRPYVSARGKPDPRILEALQLKLGQQVSFNEASRRVFGSARKASTIRYWFNKQNQRTIQ